jgi:hypothetical protein
MAGRFSLFARPGTPRPGAAPLPAQDEEPAPPDAAAPGPAAEPFRPPPASRPVPPQRERRALLRQREIELRDVGGLAVEMARRDDWRYELLRSRCAEVLTLEERIHELDAIIAAGEMAARGIGVAPCVCGAPILRGAHFCSHCGRPAPETPPVATCTHCGQPLPAEANFCTVCGNAVAADEFEGEAEIDDTLAGPAGAERDRPTHEE